jgi:hypothetical protein
MRGTIGQVHFGFAVRVEHDGVLGIFSAGLIRAGRSSFRWRFTAREQPQIGIFVAIIVERYRELRIGNLT